jgi:murein DD-endopeptidase MepM/ murein hydrolase activator NlpD
MSSKRNLINTAILAALLANSVAIVPVRAAVPVVTTVEASEAVPAAPALEVPTATIVPEVAAPAPSAPALSVDSSEAFIDRTDYSIGATQAPSSTPSYQPPSEIVIVPGTQAATTTEAPTSPGVQVGSVNLSSAGIGWTGEAAPIEATPEASSASRPEASYSITSPGLPYFNPKLIQSMMAMGNDKLRLQFPVAIPAPITSLFGWRIHPLTGSQRMHTGSDIGAPMGAPVLAALSGRVILADAMGGYGMAVAIEHDNGMRQTLYAHMSELFVKPGDKIQQGAVIGRVGSTGASTGPHLHFEFRQMMPDGTWVALDAGQHLEVAVGDLVRSLQIAQTSKPIAQRPQKSTNQ